MSFNPDSIDKVFKALGHISRRRILRLLAQGPRYPYELSKLLDMNRRVVLKHLDALQEAGLVESEEGESDLGPPRTYYRLRVGFGLSTTILPDAFVVRMTQVGGKRILSIPQGFIVPEARTDVRAVRRLLAELNKVNRKLQQIDEERLRFASLRSKIIHQIEDIMQDCDWDKASCQRVRTLIDPVYAQEHDELTTIDESPAIEVEWSKALDEAMTLFEHLFTSGKIKSSKDLDDDEIEIDIE